MNELYNQETFLKELTSMSAEELNKIIEANGKSKVKKLFDRSKQPQSIQEVNDNGRRKNNE